ncbi:hypothetical protein KGF56_000819 [Candida oxycetoniae]|uniref:Globin domain-containing protein n=1 Tax=Candida oxycetoniae TaxID=497107 RepID=A0AAI9WZM1_9ASCO|nr:uncharacterized protein KGF56_000819 [Candida oxycetoniae]KAI3406338.2 hypothetical protein KGF56_000819 [Candida oxycetoniae]
MSSLASPKYYSSLQPNNKSGLLEASALSISSYPPSSFSTNTGTSTTTTTIPASSNGKGKRNLRYKFEQPHSINSEQKTTSCAPQNSSNFSDNHSLASTSSKHSKNSAAATKPIEAESGIKNHDLSSDIKELSYHLVKVDTRMSMDQRYLESPLQYAAKLNLTQNEIDMVRYTWNQMLMEDKSNKIKQIPGEFSTSATIGETPNCSSISLGLFCRQFYANILIRAPDLEKMFPSIKHQAISFAEVMTLIISQLEDLSVLNTYFVKLAKKHSRVLGIGAVHFEVMGEALMQTFRERFGPQFTLELEILWIKVYLFLANTLMQMGLDPRLRPELIESKSSYNGSSSLSESSDANSLMTSDAEVGSILTNTTTKSPCKSHTSFAANKRLLMSTPAPLPNEANHPQPIPQIVEEKKTKSNRFARIKRKGGDCVVM